MFAALAFVAALSPLAALAAPVESRGGSRFTYYDTSVGLGSCGVLHQNSEYTVALNSADLAAYGSSYPSPACGKSIWVTYGGKTVSATIQDECPSCGSGELDLSEGLFSALADQSVGVIYGSWGYNGASSPPAETTPVYVAPTTTTPAWTPEATTPASVAPTTTEAAWVAPITTEAAWVAPTTTEAAWTPATTASPPAATHTAIVESASPAAAATSASWSSENLAQVDAPTMCPNSTLILFNDASVLFNGSYAPQLNGTNTLLANVSAMVINSLLPNATAYCFNSTFSLYNASTFNPTSPTSSNSSSLFSIFAAVNRS